MDNGMARKIEKARKYANEERDRISVSRLEVNFEGTNNDHVVSFANEKWNCDCDFFIGRGLCTHTMALEKIMENVNIGAVAA